MDDDPNLRERLIRADHLFLAEAKKQKEKIPRSTIRDVLGATIAVAESCLSEVEQLKNHTNSLRSACIAFIAASHEITADDRGLRESLRMAIEAAGDGNDADLASHEGVHSMPPDPPLFLGILVREWDTIQVTGTTGSGIRYVNLIGTVGTVSWGTDGDPEDPPAIKVWPNDSCMEMLSEDDRRCGKLWFTVGSIEAIKIIERNEIDFPAMPIIDPDPPPG